MAPGRARRRAQRRPVRADQRRREGASWPRRATRRRSTGCPRDRRYAEKLATPDITIADLIGEVDPIRVAEGRYLSDELTLHFGLIPRANRGIFALNELPDLAERIQVGLLNVLEERDVQVRGFTIRLPLDLLVVASANPEDYTSRGRIITPLKDRLGSQIRTHYPHTLEHEIDIVRQEKQVFPEGDDVPPVVVPRFMEELVVELTHLARRSPEISQRSGVSVRVSVANTEVLEAAAIKRAVRLREPMAAPRISDLGAVLATTTGKVEVETVGEDTPEERIVERLVTKAVFATFNRRASVDRLAPVIEAFEDGLIIETGERVPSREYVRWMGEVPGLHDAVMGLGTFDVTDGAEVSCPGGLGGQFLLQARTSSAAQELPGARDGRRRPSLAREHRWRRRRWSMAVGRDWVAAARRRAAPGLGDAVHGDADRLASGATLAGGKN